MATRRQENLNSMGMVVSIIFSFFGFYYQHLRTSEAVDVLLYDSSVKMDNVPKLESMTVNLVLVNKGDNSITVSDLWFEFDVGAPTCCIRKAAIKGNEDSVTGPLIVPPKQAHMVALRFTFEYLPTGGPWVSNAPYNFRIRTSTGEEFPPPAPRPPPINVEKISIVL